MKKLLFVLLVLSLALGVMASVRAGYWLPVYMSDAPLELFNSMGTHVGWLQPGNDFQLTGVTATPYCAIWPDCPLFLQVRWGNLCINKNIATAYIKEADFNEQVYPAYICCGGGCDP